MKTTKKKRVPARRKLGERARRMMATLHSVSVNCPLVIDLGDPALREAFRIWWHPYDMGADFDELTGSGRTLVRGPRTAHGGRGTIRHIPAKRPVMRGDSIERRKLDPTYYRRIDRAFGHIFPTKSDGHSVGRKRPKKRHALPSARPAPVKVVIMLDYPLTARQRQVVTIDRRYPGAIFAAAHDFYRELYDQDEKGGGKPGPMNGGRGPLLNRGRGPLVWGHDLGDLVFEGCRYRKFKPDEAKRLGAEGEFTFLIGS